MQVQELQQRYQHEPPATSLNKAKQLRELLEQEHGQLDGFDYFSGKLPAAHACCCPLHVHCTTVRDCFTLSSYCLRRVSLTSLKGHVCGVCKVGHPTSAAASCIAMTSIQVSHQTFSSFAERVCSTQGWRNTSEKSKVVVLLPCAVSLIC